MTIQISLSLQGDNTTITNPSMIQSLSNETPVVIARRIKPVNLLGKAINIAEAISILTFILLMRLLRGENNLLNQQPENHPPSQ